MFNKHNFAHERYIKQQCQQLKIYFVYFITNNKNSKTKFILYYAIFFLQIIIKIVKQVSRNSYSLKLFNKASNILSK